MTETTTLPREYVEARRNGYSPAAAVALLRSVRESAAVLTWSYSESDVEEHAPYGTDCSPYRVDADELRRMTSQPATHVTMPDGTHPTYTADLPVGASAFVYVYADDDARDQIDEDCYSDEDRAAWRDDQWTFVGVSAVVVLADGRTGESAVWGVEQGDYWPGTDESDVWHVVPDQIAQALAEATRTTATPTPRPCPTCGR